MAKRLKDYNVTLLIIIILNTNKHLTTMKRKLFLFAFAISILAANAETPIGNDAVDKKMDEITRIISLGAVQKSILRKAYIQYRSVYDPACYKVTDIKASVELIYRTKKQFHETMMKVLTESQIIRYVNVAYAPEIEAKTNYKMSLLEENGEYTDSELESMRKGIYRYLMLEKVVYFRDKYDYAKQKNNISRLKKLQPAALKESNNIEKQKGMGRLVSGKIKW